MLYITNHGKGRLRERCGIPKKSVKRMADKAFKYGLTHKETTGNLNKYITSLWSKNKNADNIRVYGDKVYIFCGTSLITVLNLPTTLRSIARKCFERRTENGWKLTNI